MTITGTIKPEQSRSHNPNRNRRQDVNKMDVDDNGDCIANTSLIIPNPASDTDMEQPRCSSPSFLSISSSDSSQSSFDSNRNSYCDVVKNGRSKNSMDIDTDHQNDNADHDMNNNEQKDNDFKEEREEKHNESNATHHHHRNTSSISKRNHKRRRIQRQRQRHTQRQREHTENGEEEEQKEERRQFQFNIQNDANLQSIINDNLSDSADDISPNNHNGERTTLRNLSVHSHNVSEEELTSDYILSKLYNYMKISEMSKYGISVFEMTFSSYLPYLNEMHLTKLATSYWCNGAHFKCMISHRGDRIKSLNKNDSDSNEWFSSMKSSKNQKCSRLQLKITSDLLDAAMQSGASVDKIEAMLLQKRVDNGMSPYNKSCTKTISRKKKKFYQTTEERNFYLRNLKHRFWNHEVLVRVFIQNGWLTSKLAEIALKTFINTIYQRVLQSKASMKKNKNVTDPPRVGGVKFSETFLHSFFVSYFCLDDIPKMYKDEIKAKTKRNGQCYASQISEETLRRWCELIELLASRGANVAEQEFKKVIPLQYALQLGKNTFKIISSSHKMKNEQLLPVQYHQQNICVPDDIWDVLVSYL